MASNRKRAVVFAAKSPDTNPAESSALNPAHPLLPDGSACDPISGTENPLPSPPADWLLVDNSNPERLADASMGALGLFQLLPEGAALLDDQLQIRWHNTQFQQILGSTTPLAGYPLQLALTPADGTDLNRVGLPEYASPAVTLTVRRDNKSVLALRIVRTPHDKLATPTFLLTLRDITSQTYEKQKQEAIYRAGLELHDLTPDEVTQMTPDERVALLKEQILQATQEVLGYDKFEIRLLKSDSLELVPLLEFGMAPEAASRRLFAAETGNGVTGFVAYSKRSYLCADTQNDKLYLSGAADARSSLTVPLMIAIPSSVPSMSKARARSPSTNETSTSLCSSGESSRGR